jgi:hypothetical protein
MMKYYHTILATVLIALAIAATEIAEEEYHGVRRRVQSITDIGDIFTGFFGAGFFVCDTKTNASESVPFYLYFFYLGAGIVFNLLGNGGGGFLGKEAGKC